MAEEGQLTENFHITEVECGCGCGLVPTPEFMYKVQNLRDKYGHAMKVNSGARCKDYNTEVNGSPNSRHMQLCAIDISLPNPVLRAKLNQLARARGFSIGHYSWGSHYDLGRAEQIEFWGKY